jgi:hypothetical protein
MQRCIACRISSSFILALLYRKPESDTTDSPESNDCIHGLQKFLCRYTRIGGFTELFVIRESVRQELDSENSSLRGGIYDVAG